MKLSLTLPSLFPEPAARIVDNVRATIGDVDYEIIVVGPFEMSGPDIRCVAEGTPRGCAAAHATAYEHATGDVIFPLVDDIRLAEGWATEGLRSLLRFERGRPYALGIGQTNMIVGTVFGIYYPFFPMIRRATLDAVGGFFSPRYKHHFTDADLAFRIWSIGGACGFTERNYIERTTRESGGSAAPAAAYLADSRATAARTDKETFLGFWGSRYGGGWKTEEIRDFNIDVDPIFRLLVAEGNTIYRNHPSFADDHRRYLRNMAGLRVNVQFEAVASV